MNHRKVTDIVEDARKCWNQGDVEGYLSMLYTEESQLYYLPPGLPQGIAGARIFYALYATAFPNSTLEFDDILVEEDVVAIRFHMHMRHLNEFQGIPATGKDVVLSGITILRFAEGKVIERWSESDILGLFEQIGAIQK